MKYDSRLIRRPHAQPPLRRTAWGFVTAAFWLFYFYLWAPLVTFLLWLFGIHTATHELYLRESHVDPFLLLVLPLVALVCAMLLIAWAEYNRFRFRGKDRRRAQPNASNAEIAAALGASTAITQMLAKNRISVLHMDEHARPRSVGTAHARLADMH